MDPPGWIRVLNCELSVAPLFDFGLQAGFESQFPGRSDIFWLSAVPDADRTAGTNRDANIDVFSPQLPPVRVFCHRVTGRIIAALHYAEKPLGNLPAEETQRSIAFAQMAS